jgi:tRNA(Ile2) C34 agmatinyltransferase TiaS
MGFIRLSGLKTTADVVSGILNWVCPECGGRMGGRGKEFKCQGECQMDWRQLWEQVLASGRRSSVHGI